ncbi:MAG: hypothetical protein SFU27_06445 [Thermonemataceae bacterium]|nr:hypothetical protein [Thermonemataceae bacterium]
MQDDFPGGIAPRNRLPSGKDLFWFFLLLLGLPAGILLLLLLLGLIHTY